MTDTATTFLAVDPAAPEQRTVIVREEDGTYTLIRSHTYGDHGRYDIRARSACGTDGGCGAVTGPRPLLLAWQPGLTDCGDGVLTGHSPDLPPGVELTVSFPDGATLTGVSEAGGLVVFGEHSLPGGEHEVTAADPAGEWRGSLTVEIPRPVKAPTRRARKARK